MAETRTPDLFDRLLARNGAVSRPDAAVPLARPRPAMPFERLPAAPLTEIEVEVDAAPAGSAATAVAPSRASARPAAGRGAPVPQPSVLSRVEETVRAFETVRTVSAVPPGAEQAAAPAVVPRVVERLVPPAGPVLPPAFVEQALEQPAYPRPVADTPAHSPARTAGPAPARPAAPLVAPRPGGETRRRDTGGAPAQPAVQVSIGRLEVTTAAPEPKRERDGRGGRPEPAVGLEAFLDRHSLNRQEAM
jgi:hypothetical protein